MGAETHNKAETAWLKDQHVELAASAGKVGNFEWNLVTGEIFWLPQNHLIFGVDLGSEITYGTFLNLSVRRTSSHWNARWRPSGHRVSSSNTNIGSRWRTGERAP